jgi:hypothetical protein
MKKGRVYAVQTEYYPVTVCLLRVNYIQNSIHSVLFWLGNQLNKIYFGKITDFDGSFVVGSFQSIKPTGKHILTCRIYAVKVNKLFAFIFFPSSRVF